MLRKLGIEPGERGVVVWGMAALLMLGWTDVSVKNVSETLFNKRVGVEFLPWVFLANGPTATQHSVADQMAGSPYVAADTMNLWIENERQELGTVALVLQFEEIRTRRPQTFILRADLLA